MLSLRLGEHFVISSEITRSDQLSGFAFLKDATKLLRFF